MPCTTETFALAAWAGAATASPAPAASNARPVAATARTRRRIEYLHRVGTFAPGFGRPRAGGCGGGNSSQDASAAGRPVVAMDGRVRIRDGGASMRLELGMARRWHRCG